MKTRAAQLCMVFAALAGAGSAQTETGAVRTPVTEKTGPATTTPETQQPLTLAEAQKSVAATRRYVAHPSPADKGEPRTAAPVEDAFRMADPPPPAPAETMPASPVAGHVWVPGHYMPLEGKWRWVRGEWAAPATPVSVWIPARYDAKEKKWTPGYWQPDRPATPDPAATSKDGPTSPYE
ncbi:MAG TPA: hypothetical protein VM029_00270 [Opitutaceae bacterium]|nr:hypothetical protein [Opitutaceae bacterium]